MSFDAGYVAAREDVMLILDDLMTAMLLNGATPASLQMMATILQMVRDLSPGARA